MKKILSLILISAAFTANAQTHKLEFLWETDSVIAVPESVLPELKKNTMYVSLIDCAGWVADGKGGIGKMSPDGKTYDGNWITGLHAPKGLGIVGNRLYVADMSDVIIIDIAKAQIEKRISPDSAKGLNDITVTDGGIVYVSDSRAARVWKIENDVAILYLDSVKGVNGLKAIGDEL